MIHVRAANTDSRTPVRIFLPKLFYDEYQQRCIELFSTLHLYYSNEDYYSHWHDRRSFIASRTVSTTNAIANNDFNSVSNDSLKLVRIFRWSL